MDCGVCKWGPGTEASCTKAGLAFGWPGKKGRGYNQETAVKGGEGPDLQMHVKSAWFPAAHWAMTDARPCQVPSEGSWVVLGTWWLRQALGRSPSCPLNCKNLSDLGEKTLKKASVLTQVLQSQGYFDMREAKINTTSKSVSNFFETFVSWTMTKRLHLPMPHRSVSSTLFKGSVTHFYCLVNFHYQYCFFQLWK